MRIIQITDLHINTTPEPVNGVYTRENFRKTIGKAKEHNPDLLVLSGDLGFHSGDKETYQWIKKQLDDLAFTNYKIIGGNHDDINTLADVFEIKNSVAEGELYYFSDPDIFFLDTVKGFCNPVQWDWFRSKMMEIGNENPVIFMHHPPFKAKVPHMDNKYAFQQSEIFENICLDSGKKPYVFCGHYHNEISQIRNGISVFITPSTYLQIGSAKEEFEIEHRVPGYRIIDLNNNTLNTKVKYVFDK